MKRVIRSTEISDRNRFAAFIPNMISIVTGIIESFLLIRVILKLLGANEQNAFVDFVYSISAFFVRPFRNIFENLEVREGMILEINTLIAMIVYALIAWIIIAVIYSFIGRREKDEFVDL